MDIGAIACYPFFYKINTFYFADMLCSEYIDEEALRCIGSRHNRDID